MKLRKKHLTIAIITVCLLVVAVLFLGKGENTTHSAPAAETTSDTTANTAAKDGADASGGSGSPINLNEVNATIMVAENDRFQLYFDDKSAQVRLRDRKTGMEWNGAPRVDDKMPPNNKKLVVSPVNIYYTIGKEIVTTNPEKEKATISIAKLDEGVKVIYHVDSLGLTFATEYRLTETGLDVKVPFDSIMEKGAARLTGLELMPFFEAASLNDKGALFVPDGSGALLTYDASKPSNFDFYSDYIYGGDHAFQTNVYQQVGAIRFETVSKSPREKIALPVYGLYKEGKAFLGIVTGGAADAKINAYPSGVRNIQLYRISAEFIYRNDDTIFIGSSGEIPMTQSEMIEGDRSIRFVLLQGDKADYVGMAESYRDYLTAEHGLQLVEDNKAKLQLRLFGGVLRDEVIGSTYMKMTTFNEAKKMIDKFLEQGIEAIEVTYEGWSDNGYLGNQPGHFPAEGKLGGNKELKKLAAYLKDIGIPLYLEANYVKPFSESDEVSPNKEAIRGLNKEVMKLYKPYEGTLQHSSELYYLLKPKKVFDDYIKDEADDFKKSGAGGVLLEHMGELIYSDHDKLPAFSRSETIDTWRKSMELMKKSVGRVAVEYGMAYSLGLVDRIDNIPVDSSHFAVLDETVPFYEIAVHGFIPYTAKPANLSDDPRIYMLRLLENGALPSYELTYQDSSELKRTRITELFSTGYKNWVQPASESYNELAEVLGPLADQKIADHEILMKKVKRTTYEDGTQIIVNYNPHEITVEGNTIAGFGYKVLKGVNR